MREKDADLLTDEESAKRLRVSPFTVYRWIAKGTLPAVRFSRKVIRIRRSDLESSPQAETAGATRNYPAVREAAVAYKIETATGEGADMDELMEIYKKSAYRSRLADEAERGSAAALARNVGISSGDAGRELWRAGREAREESRHDVGHDLD